LANINGGLNLLDEENLVPSAVKDVLMKIAKKASTG
jgi:hypothetical protein